MCRVKLNGFHIELRLGLLSLENWAMGLHELGLFVFDFEIWGLGFEETANLKCLKD